MTRETSEPLLPLELRRFKPYPAYKDSGIEWLGEIPAHWAISRISELMTLLNGYPFDSEHFVKGEGAPLVRIRDLYETETEVNYSGPFVENAWIETGDVIIGMDGDFNVARWRGQRALLNQRMCCLRPRATSHAGFISHVLPLPLKVVNDRTYSTTVKHLSSGDIRKIRLGSPPPDEKCDIAAFLDRETMQIDGLVSKKERLIELLQEKRAALITQAVTKGLDPSVPMKDSGVGWLGQIPRHWEVKPLKHLVPGLTVGIVVTPAKYYVDDGVSCLRSLNIARGHIDMNNLVFISNEANALHRKSQIREGDVLVVRTGQAGAAAVVPADLEGANCIDLLIIRRSRVLRPWFLYYYLNSAVATSQAELRSVGAIQAHYNTSVLSELLVPAMPLAEQWAIEQHLDVQIRMLDGLGAKVREAIDHLKELRAALISAAVTGKIDVRAA